MNLLFLLLLSLVAAFDCSVSELSQYDFKKIQGTYGVTKEKNTPPSKTETDWNIGICEEIDVKECKGSDLCGLTKITLDDKTIVSQIIKIDSDISYKPFKTTDENGITLSYSDFKYGDDTIKADIKFICDTSDDKDLTLDSWDGKHVKLSFKTKSACVEAKKEKPDNGESWGWFTWIFIFFVLFLSIYIIGGAWFQYSKGNSIDFQTALKEVLENFVDVVKGLPIFVKEVIEKFSNSNRGEYSAV